LLLSLVVLSATTVACCSLLSGDGLRAHAPEDKISCPAATEALAWRESFVWEGAPPDWLRSTELSAHGCKDDKGRPHGAALFFWDGDGRLAARGAFNHGKSDGVWSFFYEDGSRAVVVVFSNGLRHGRMTAWGRTGNKLVESDWVDGFLEGDYREWYPNGTLRSRVPYAGGKIQGVMRRYDETGELIEAVRYNQGEVVGGAYRL